MNWQETSFLEWTFLDPSPFCPYLKALGYLPCNFQGDVRMTSHPPHGLLWECHMPLSYTPFGLTKILFFVTCVSSWGCHITLLSSSSAMLAMGHARVSTPCKYLYSHYKSNGVLGYDLLFAKTKLTWHMRPYTWLQPIGPAHHIILGIKSQEFLLVGPSETFWVHSTIEILRGHQWSRSPPLPCLVIVPVHMA